MATDPTMAMLQHNPSTSAAGAFCTLDFWEGRVGSLDATFARVREEFAIEAGTQFRVIVQGLPRPLEPLIRDEVYLIGHEALSNAFRHAHASDVEVELEYAANHLRVLVRDNGAGIDPRIADSAVDTCWGLWTMKERAKRIGARLKVLSRVAAGTEVELLLPAGVAFGTRESAAVRWLSKLYS
jgi:signal transduction histidine kinase